MQYKIFRNILAPKAVVGIVPKKGLGKLSLQIRTRINRIMKNKSRTVISGSFTEQAQN